MEFHVDSDMLCLCAIDRDVQLFVLLNNNNTGLLLIVCSCLAVFVDVNYSCNQPAAYI